MKRICKGHRADVISKHDEPQQVKNVMRHGRSSSSEGHFWLLQPAVSIMKPARQHTTLILNHLKRYMQASASYLASSNRRQGLFCFQGRCCSGRRLQQGISAP